MLGPLQANFQASTHLHDVTTILAGTVGHAVTQRGRWRPVQVVLQAVGRMMGLILSDVMVALTMH